MLSCSASAIASCAALLRALLQRRPNTSVTGQGLAANESRPGHREYPPAADPRRIAPPLRPDLICDSDNMAKTPFAEYDHVIKTLASDRADQSFGIAVPR